MDMFSFFKQSFWFKETPIQSPKTICSILTGVPVSVRDSQGNLTPAGYQQIYWCDQIMKDMGKRKFKMVPMMGKRVKMTREFVLEHKASI